MSKKKVKEFTAHAQIIQGKLAYSDLQKFKEKFESIKNENENEYIEVKYKVIDKAAHFLFKYYWGSILPILSQNKGYKEIFRIHISLKKDFLFQKIDSGKWTDIPLRFLTNIKIATVNLNKLFDVNIQSGTTVIILDGEKIIGVIPSHATLTHKEMYDFIKQCENVMFDMISDFEITPEMQELRNLAAEVINKTMEKKGNLENQLKLEFSGAEI